MPLKRLNNKVRITSLFLAVMAMLIFGYALINGSLAGRDAALKAGEVDTMNIANSLSTQVNLSFRAADLLMHELTALTSEGRFSDAALQLLMEKLMARQSLLFPQMDSLQILDENGRLRHAWPAASGSKRVEVQLPPQMDSSSASADPQRLHIGVPVRSVATGQWIIPLTRPLVRQGKPAGLIRIGVSVEYFARQFNDFDIGRSGALVLATDDGIMLLRRPFDPQFLGKSMSDATLFKDHVQQRPAGWAMIRSSQDGVVRLNYFTRVPDYPLFVTAALARDDILADWRKAQRTQLLVIFSASLIIGLLTIYLLYVIKMRDHAEEKIEKKNLHLRLLAEKLKSQALLDGMTGLANRRYLDEQLQKAIQGASRSQSPVALIMFDVDWFKKFNDLYGHVQGDYCLQGVARALQAAQRRQGDLAARYGGEEFALLLPDTGLPAAHRIAQRVLDAVRAQQIPHEGSQSGVVTISAGVVSCIPPADATIADLFTHADSALYLAKNNGRDRVQDWRALSQVQVA